MVTKLDEETFVKAIHDLCVAAGVKCGHRACQEAAPSVKRVAQTSSRRRRLSVREAEAMGARRPLTLTEAQPMRGQ